MTCELPQPFPSIFIPVGITIPINKGMNKCVDKRLITMWSNYVYDFLMSPMIIISDTVKPGYNLHMSTYVYETLLGGVFLIYLLWQLVLLCTLWIYLFFDYLECYCVVVYITCNSLITTKWPPVQIWILLHICHNQENWQDINTKMKKILVVM